MTKLRPFFREYRETGALHALVSIEAAIDEHVLATKSGDLVMFLAVRGQDSECLDPAQIETITRSFESAAEIFDEHFRVYQYFYKREHPGMLGEHYTNPVVEEAVQSRLEYLATKPDRLHTTEIYFAVVYENWHRRAPGATPIAWLSQPLNAMRRKLSLKETANHLSVELEQARELLHNRVQSFMVQLRDTVEMRILDCRDAFRLLRRLLNYSPEKSEPVALKSNHFLDVQACSSSLECHHDFLRLDDNYVAVLTLKEPPAQTFAQMFRNLADLRFPFILVSEWKREETGKIRGLIQAKRRHFHNSKTSLATHLPGPTPSGARDALVDNAAVAMVGDLGACLEEIEVHGRYFGEFSLTLLLYGSDPAALRREVAQCFKLSATQDAQLTEERYNRLSAWLAALPGNSAFNLRRMWLTNTNYADLAFLFASDTGEARNEHLNAEYLAVLEGRGGAPYFLNLHYQDVAHTFVLGATGSGKSFILNFALTSLQKYAPLTTIFDLGGSYESLTQLFSGSYWSLCQGKRQFTINPFCLPPTPDNLLFLLAWMRVLIESGSYRLQAGEAQDLFEQIENLYQLAPDQRRLSTLARIVQQGLRRELLKWTQDGPYGELFDHAEDTLTFSAFQTFDFEGMQEAKEQLEPLLFYVLHRASAAMDEDPRRFKVFVMDEAWRFFAHPEIRRYLVEALKTWRKKNAAVILATQSSDDLRNSEILPVIVESCPTQMFLANPGMDRDLYRQTFHLNAAETDLIARLAPKQQLLIKRPDRSKVASLAVDRKEYWIYTSHPHERERRREAFARHGFHAGLETLVKENT